MRDKIIILLWNVIIMQSLKDLSKTVSDKKPVLKFVAGNEYGQVTKMLTTKLMIILCKQIHNNHCRPLKFKSTEIG